MSYSLTQLNQMDRGAFTDALGAVFEDTPAIAERTWDKRPFQSIAELHAAMILVVNSMSLSEQMALICAHPSLGDRVKMAEASVLEQSSLGLDRLSQDEYNLFQALNRAYRERFGFPFIIAVRNHSKASILEAFEQRLQNPAKTEKEQALKEIAQIAWFRLQDSIFPSLP
ncbi:2-oxo-4-hydroxy-4-carboxy-5-ureidoimidazoline decarboxylase [Tumidithrix elongata RA019]|uniref:2-oxo-4-hydroxy-4-carboxy-5-ureidoimidazoline decarboxylase n=1 Tax=Tumidithrix elongata BACA0141 TaxID=2716417 RepID=A0AAW9Q1I3_9CYAN|nr:2-oxo-4-hydroxy-4-carboxy-5-ureidoimidazoline decarboxylase [Tumidithrix elongata RA019]